MSNGFKIARKVVGGVLVYVGAIGLFVACCATLGGSEAPSE